MDNTLTFSKLHKSITSLPEVTLPKLVVLTGCNGSGKTHLLEAITNGGVRSSIAPNFQTDILLFDWNSMIPKDTGAFNPSEHQMICSRLFQTLKGLQEQQFVASRDIAIKGGIPADLCNSYLDLKSIDTAKLKEVIPDSQQAHNAYMQLMTELNNVAESICHTICQDSSVEMRKCLSDVLTDDPFSFFETSESKFFSNSKFLWREVDIFEQAFGRLFSTYRELIHQNYILEKFISKESNSQKHLDEKQFIEKHGEPPWDFVNEILKVSHLGFHIEPPLMHEASSSYEPKLKKLSTGVEMRFKDLSSGEKVLMSFALCLCNVKDKRREQYFPKLLLLDEVDAPLHPSMALSLLRTIQEVLVNEKGISVILTTHSPSTVALAPEKSLYEMNPIGPKVEKVSRSRALTILTAGVPTLSISFDGRRQVFVESRIDAYIYTFLYQAYKDELDTERSLTFIEVGKKNASGVDENSGCDQVKRIVSELVGHGNVSVFGLVDWDGERESMGRIHISSPGIRDGLESLIYDPVLLAAIIIKMNVSFCVEHEIILENDRYTHIYAWDQQKWQTIVDKLQSKITGDLSPEVITITYLNGMELDVYKSYLHYDDHELETKIITMFGFLKPASLRPGGLMIHIMEEILRDHPRLLPYDLITTFSALLTEEV